MCADVMPSVCLLEFPNGWPFEPRLPAGYSLAAGSAVHVGLLSAVMDAGVLLSGHPLFPAVLPICGVCLNSRDTSLLLGEWERPGFTACD